jgi:hypothetical protein
MEDLKKRIQYLYGTKPAPGTYTSIVGPRTFTFRVQPDKLEITDGSGGTMFRVLGMYSGDRTKAAFDTVMITPEVDRCFRIALGKGASKNPQAEAAAILRSNGVGATSSDDPFGAPTGGDPFSSPGATDPFGTPSGEPSPTFDPSDGWGDLDVVVPTTNADINASLFDKEGTHAIRPAQFQNLLEFLPLTVEDARKIVGIARGAATTDSLAKNLRIVGSSASSWSKGCFHAAISSAQNSDRAGYDYFAVSTALLNAAVEYYGKVARFSVVPSGVPAGI